MAIGKYKKWLEKENLILLEGWARDGLTDEQIAEKMGISTTTLYRWKTDHREIWESLKKGKEVVDFEVENALLMNAKKGDTTAQIFWLKNRRPDKWRDSRDRTDKQDKLMTAQLQKAEAEAQILQNKANKLSDDIHTNELLEALVNPTVSDEGVVDLD